MRTVLLIASTIVLSLAGCQMEQSLGAQEFVEFVVDEDNGLRKEKEINGIRYAVQYQPQEFLQAQKSINKASYTSPDQGQGEEEALQYFLMRIEALNGASDPIKVGTKGLNEYYERVEYLSFQVANDLKVVEGNDTLACRLAHLERTYNLSPYINLVLAFDKSQNTQGTHTEKIFVYNDRIFNAGQLLFRFDSRAIKNLPKLSEN